MSAEVVVKKRRRPTKIVPEPIEDSMPISEVKKATRAKSTKAIPKVTSKASTASNGSAKALTVEPSAPTPVASPANPKIPQQSAAQPSKPVKSATPTRPSLKQTTENAEQPPSTILSQIRELETRKATSNTTSTAPSGVASKTMPSTAAQTSASPQPITTSSKSTIPSTYSQTKTHTSSKPPPPPSPFTSTPPQPPKPASSKPQVPLAAFNKEMVSSITSRAGARPGTGGKSELPKGYQSAARKVTMTIVALPIAIVTSYVLYQRLILREAPKQLVPVTSSNDTFNVEVDRKQ